MYVNLLVCVFTVLFNIVNISLINFSPLLVSLYLLNINTKTLHKEFVSYVQNNLISYNCSPSLNSLYNFGFCLAVFMIVQIFSGILLSIHYSNNNGFISILYLMKENVMSASLFRLMHSMLPSFIHLCLVMHILRAIYYLSFLFTPTIYLSGVILFILAVAISFLGYVLPFGQMSFWGASVITNIFALIPNLMELLLGNFVMCEITLRRFYVLHFVASLILIVVMLVHIIYLHKFGSTNPLHFNGLKVSFFPYFYAKDLYLIFGFFILFLLNYFNFIELSHSDNNIEANPLVTPLHIVPEWYFLFLYTVLKAINSKIAGLIIVVLFFVIMINVVCINYTVIYVWNSNNLFIVIEWLSFYLILAFVGEKLPLGIYLYLAKVLLLLQIVLFKNSLFFFKYNITMEPYFTINGYSYYFTLFNFVLMLELAIINMNIEINEFLINNYILISFIILSEILLFLSMFGLLFNVYTFFYVVPHYHLYYLGLLLLCHASLLQNIYFLFIICYFFINLQIIEYRNMAFQLNYNISTTLFYVITTLHLLHILVGLYMVIFYYNTTNVNYSISTNNFFKMSISLSSFRQQEYAIVLNLYWNFVETLWLLIFFLYSFFNIQLREYGSLNHKLIGMNYFICGVYFGVVAILYSLLMRLELFSSGNRIIFEQSNFVYNYLISLHGLAMIFFFVMPIVFASFGNIYLPININAAELKMSKLNNLSLIIFILSFVVVVNASILEFGIGVGWTLNPPLSTYSINLSKLSLELIMVGLLLNGFASLLSSMNFFISLFYMMNIYVVNYLSLFTVAILLSSYMLILSLPVLTCGFLSILIDIILNTVLLDPAFGGDPIFYQHLFWFFGHPEVYIMILPSFGLLNGFMQVLTAKIVFGSSTMNLALVGITFLGFVVWAHHMFTTGLESDTRAYFTAVTIMISIPTGTKIFNWLCSYYCNYTLFMQLNIFVLFFVFIFTIGGASGIMLGNGGLDIMLHDTYYVVGHFHQVLAIASVLSILLFILMYLENFHFIRVFNTVNISNLNFIYVNLFIHINLLFMNLLFLGFAVLPRRIPEYADESVCWNMIASINSMCVFLLVFLFL